MTVVLIVEDERFICDLAQILIQEWGYETLSANDVGEALLLLRSLQQIDVLFTDINLKKEVQGGLDLALQAIKLRPKLRVLYTTGNRITDNMRTLFVEGADCLRKPYTPDQLQHSLESLRVA